MRRLEDLPRVEVASREALRAWLAEHHGQAESIWLVTYKRSDPTRYLPYDAVVDEAMAFGWVDSLPREVDAQRTMRLLSPRKPGSAWSKVNKSRVERLTSAGRMAPAGLAAVERAKADGSWAKLDEVETLAVPEDLTAALVAHPPAAQIFEAFPPSSKRLILEWIAQAKAPPTRAKRILETAELAAQGLRAHHARQPRTAAVPR